MQELDKEKCGAFIALLRKQKGMTQKQLAWELMISDKAVSKWERGLSSQLSFNLWGYLRLPLQLTIFIGFFIAVYVVGKRYE